MIARSPREFADAAGDHPFGACRLDDELLLRAAASIREAGLLVVGEPHGVRETPSVVYELACALGTRAIAFEWSHEEMDEPVQEFLSDRPFEFEGLWSLPPSAEFFCGDGRITAGHFALLRRLRDEGRLEQVIPFDRLDPQAESPGVDWQVRDRELAERLLSGWDDRLPLLVLTGAFHAQQEIVDGETMGTHLARARDGVGFVMLDYASGFCWSRGELHDVSGPMPSAPMTLKVPQATPAVVPGPRERRGLDADGSVE